MTRPEQLHLARIRNLPCCRCGWPGPSEAHHCDTPPKIHFATIPLCPTTRLRVGCHRGPTGAGHAPGLGREELELLRDTLETVWEKWGPDYAEYVRERLRASWAKRLELRSGARFEWVLE